MSDTLLVGGDLREPLAAAGIVGAAELFALGLPADETSVRRLVRLDVAGTAGRFFFKGYRYPGWRKARGLIGRGTLFGQAPELRELRALEWLRAHDIPAVRAVAAAAQSRHGRLTAQALMTELVPEAPDLAARLAAPEDPLHTLRQARLAVAAALGSALARMHLHGFVHRDCHARNILVRLEDAGPRIWLLDCRRARLRRGFGARHAMLHDLACLRLDLRPARDAVFGASEWTHLLVSYLGTEAGTAGLDARIVGVAAGEARAQAKRAARRAHRRGLPERRP